jgi:hypothetical protein
LYTSPRLRSELTTPVVIGTDCICSCKSNYHTITATYLVHIRYMCTVQSGHTRNNIYIFINEICQWFVCLYVFVCLCFCLFLQT